MVMSERMFCATGECVGGTKYAVEIARNLELGLGGGNSVNSTTPQQTAISNAQNTGRGIS